MFRTVRHWWGKGTARLFIFELVVVIAGVLIAQALAGYAQHRSDLARMELERSRVRYELASVRSAAQSWKAAMPCLDKRMTDVMAGKNFDAGGLRRPRFSAPGYTPPATEVLDLIAQTYGVEEKNRLNWIAENAANASPVLASIISRWGRLMLIDPENGQVAAQDRAEARLAAADIKAQLRAMDVLSTDTDKVLASMQIQARNQNQPTYGPARSCAAIWDSGRFDPPLPRS